jgi:hypothetical protein
VNQLINQWTAYSIKTQQIKLLSSQIANQSYWGWCHLPSAWLAYIRGKLPGVTQGSVVVRSIFVIYVNFVSSWRMGGAVMRMAFIGFPVG